MRMAAGARSKAMGMLNLVKIFVAEAPSLAAVIALYFYGSSPHKRKGRWLEEHELLIWGLLVFLADAMLISSNMQERGMPLLGVYGIVCAAELPLNDIERALRRPGARSSATFSFCCYAAS